MLVFNKYFYKKKKSKLYFGDRVTVLNDLIYQTGGVMEYTKPLSEREVLQINQLPEKRTAWFVLGCNAQRSCYYKKIART
jgi:hypothetical protein